jgi:hypothetical protein
MLQYDTTSYYIFPSSDPPMILTFIPVGDSWEVTISHLVDKIRWNYRLSTGEGYLYREQRTRCLQNYLDE